MTEGTLYYFYEAGRYGIRCNDGSWAELHCGDTLQVFYAGSWRNTRIELSDSRGWYLVGINDIPDSLPARIPA